MVDQKENTSTAKSVDPVQAPVPSKNTAPVAEAKPVKSNHPDPLAGHGGAYTLDAQGKRVKA